MPGLRHERQDEGESVRHLVELGYADPLAVAAREAAVRRELRGELQAAIELNRNGRHDEAAAALEKLVAANPDWIPPRQCLAEIHFRGSRLQEAQAQLDWLTHHGIEHPRTALIAGAIALARREMPAALVALEYARHVEPDLPTVHTLAGTVLLRVGQLDAAADAFHQAVQRNPADAQALDGLATVHLRRGKFEDAADYALQALEIDMQLSRAHYHLGVALTKLNRPQEALPALEASARTAPRLAAPYYWLARIAEEQVRDPARAATYRNRAREIIREHRRHATSMSTRSTAARTSSS